MSRPVRIAVTLGDPAGIGPEVTAGALRSFVRAEERVEVVVVGAAQQAELVSQIDFPRLRVLPTAPFTGPRGEPSSASGKAALEALEAAIDLARRDAVDALVTAPISKQALAMAGSKDVGHTWILARELAKGPVAMAFLGERLRVVLATDHIPLGRVISSLDPERILDVSRLLCDALQGWRGIAAPQLALAGLNPHAGEDRVLGDEEARILSPVVRKARDSGLSLSGPHPADSLFRRAYDGEFDGVVALYHDQGLIAVKMLGLGQTVNTTLGLKVVRTSPDHGTAFELVGKAMARPDGMLAALRTAAELARARER